MKHLIVGSFVTVLVILSFIIGGICYLYRFNSRDFFTGLRFINKKV